MTFNWPDIPFSGTEVDAFVTVYKELAQAIYDDYYAGNIATDILKTPYQDTENMRVFLENGLLYAAFIIKQRAGNVGPGTDFVIGNSPKRITLSDAERIRLIQSMGCIGETTNMFSSFQENGENIDPEAPMGPLLRDLASEVTDRDDPCDDFNQKYNENITRNDPDNDDPELKNCSDAVLSASISAAAAIGYSRWTYTSVLTFFFVAKYIAGGGGVLDRQGLDLMQGPNSSIWLREDTAKWMGQPKKLTGQTASAGGAHKFNGYTVKLVSGANGGPRTWLLSTTSEPGTLGAIKNLLGDFTVKTDGNESIAIDTSPPRSSEGEDQWDALTGKYYITNISASNIINIIDDYDFDYGYEIERGGGSEPGDPFTDDQIKSGPRFLEPNTTACEAAVYDVSSGGPINFNNPTDKRWFRYIIARGHGNGQLPTGGYEFITGVECKHKPFAINIAY